MNIWICNPVREIQFEIIDDREREREISLPTDAGAELGDEIGERGLDLLDDFVSTGGVEARLEMGACLAGKGKTRKFKVLEQFTS